MERIIRAGAVPRKDEMCQEWDPRVVCWMDEPRSMGFERFGRSFGVKSLEWLDEFDSK